MKFLSLETKNESKIKHVNNLYIDEIQLLKEKFNINHFNEKYTNELKTYREELLKQVAFNTRLEIDQANDQGFPYLRLF